jgi:hypothetical protein
LAPKSLYEFDTENWFGYAVARDMTWDCVNPVRRWCVRAVVADDRLRYLYVQINAKVVFGDVVERFGPPDEVTYQADVWRIGRCRVSLEWDQIGVSVSGHFLKPCPSPHQAQQGISPLIRVDAAYYISPALAESDKNMPLATAYPWAGFLTGLPAYWQVTPGTALLWLVGLGALLVLMGLAALKPRWRTWSYSIPLAAIAVILPTVHYQDSDVLFPMCAAYVGNTMLCSALFVAIAEGTRLLRRRSGGRSHSHSP